MAKRHFSSMIIAASVLATLAGTGSSTAAATTAATATTERAELVARAHAAWNRAAGSVAGGATAADVGPVQAAAPNDALSFADGNDVAEARADILQLGVGGVGNGGMVFTMTVEQGAGVLTGSAGVFALWGVDTNGDSDPEALVALFKTSTDLEAFVFDELSGAYICDAVAGAVANTLAVSVFAPGCFGDVKQPAVAGVLVFDNGAGVESADFAPNSLAVVRFNRPPRGASGGYAVVARGIPGSEPTFQRFGAIPTYQCFGPCPPVTPTVTTAGPFDDYLGPRPLVGTASARTFDPALWGVTDDGEVVTTGDAEYYGDAADINLARPIVGMAVRPDRSGYWLVASDGGIFSYGDAPFHGSTGGIPLQKPIVGMASTPTGDGYWLVASDGGIFNYGDAPFLGSTGSIVLNRPVVGMAAAPGDRGYWLVASDGGIFSYGVPFFGSTGSIPLQQPIVGMSATRSGAGYRFIARDGGVFSYGDAEFHGSGAVAGRADVIGLATA